MRGEPGQARGRRGDEPTAESRPPCAVARSLSCCRFDSSRNLILPDGKTVGANVKGFPTKVGGGRELQSRRRRKNRAGPTTRTLPTSPPKPAQSTPWPCGRGG